jgi:pantetheine-phosphate adenylyltransferase
MTEKVAVYAGTFDPMTFGHMDIIKRSRGLFDKVIVAVASSERKAPYFSLEQRVSMAQAALSEYDNVSVKELPDLTVDFAKEHRAGFLIRGLRSMMDFDYEAEIAEMNRKMSDGDIETVFLPTHPDHAFISSSIVRELILLKAFDKLKRFIPEPVINLIK